MRDGEACTNRDVSCTCRFAPLCPGFGGRGRAFSSKVKKPPAGLKEGSWKNSKRARALSIEPQPVGRQRREARRPGHGKLVDCGFRRHAQTWMSAASRRKDRVTDQHRFDQAQASGGRPTGGIGKACPAAERNRENYLWRSRPAPIRSATVRDFDHAPPPNNSPQQFCRPASSRLRRRSAALTLTASTTRPASWPARPSCNFFKRCPLTSAFARPATSPSRS